MEMKIKMKVENLKKSFPTQKGEVKVIKNVSFDVYDNEFLVILGPGGCGKTTLLKVMSGQMEFNDGKISTSGGKNIGFVFQNFSIFPWMTVQENVEYGLRIARVSSEERNTTAKKYIDLVGLTGFEKYYPNQISGGMKQRVGVARMLAISPDIMLMDNPLGHLDAQTKFQLQDELLRIWNVEKKTIVYVTNDVEEAVYMADRVILLSNLPCEIKAEYPVRLERFDQDGELLHRNRTALDFLALRKLLSEDF